MAKYDPGKIEKKWQKRWFDEKLYEPNLDTAKKPFYNLMMFPYPSAEGLHVGNMYAFTGSDIYGRFKRMCGYEVFEPIGLDGFGIHSENYAMKIGTHPADQAKVSEKRFYAQLHEIGNGFSWDEHLETYDPEYYHWTQWLFVQMWKNGLAYRKKQAVNWCPSCKTVLSDEQAEGGKCERCGTVVEKKELEQWFLRITNYADRLLKNLETLDWSEKVKIAQNNWIGKSEGAEIKFRISSDKKQTGEITVFTTRPDTLFGATYLVLAPEHKIIKSLETKIDNLEEVEKYIRETKDKRNEDRTEEKEKTGVELKGIKAINPVNGKEIPIWIADYVLASYGTGAIMAVPAHDQRDFEFAKKYKLPIVQVISPVLTRHPAGAGVSRGAASNTVHIESDLWEGDGELINSGKFDGMDSEAAKWEIAKFVHGERKTQFRLRDWLISRQRYWGPPIPMIFCEKCEKTGKGEQEDMPGWYAVPENKLPVTLPYVKDFRPTGSDESPLASDKEFYRVECPACGAAARRETDVSDTFLDSAWYYLRYLDPENEVSAFNNSRVKHWLPAEMYIGGAEHAVLHLLYVRFVAMALYDRKFLGFEEPFKKFRAHGLLIKDGAKMSKSKGNVINPDEYVKKFGADTLRMYLMFLASFEQGGDFRDNGILGIERFLNRTWNLAEEVRGNKEDGKVNKSNANISTLVHKTIKKITDDIEQLHYNTAISALMILLRGLEEDKPSRENLEVLLKLLAPFAPHITEEIWRETLGMESSIHRSEWPSYDPALVKEAVITLVVQVNGKIKDTISMDASTEEADATKSALSSEKVLFALAGKKPKRIIYIPKKIVNIVI